MSQQKGTEDALWSAFKTGEEDAFSRLFFAYYARLYQYGIRIATDEDLVKDVLQDLFLYLFESRDRLTAEPGNVTAYLTAAFRRRLLRDMQGRQTELDHREQKALTEAYGFEFGIDDMLIRDEATLLNQQVVQQLLEELPPRQREIIYLRFYLELSLPEIADTLSISYQVVANHLYRALKKLQRSSSSKKFLMLDLWLILSCCCLSLC